MPRTRQRDIEQAQVFGQALIVGPGDQIGRGFEADVRVPLSVVEM